MATTKPSERLLKYPPMERQDLNQSQLGSFKFTPVDKIPSFNAVAPNYLKQQLAESFARAEASRLSASMSVPAGVPTSSKVTSPPPASPDAAFFNKHIKPDLAESRLRLGPAALRSAVEGAARSPTKQDRFIMVGQEISPGLAHHATQLIKFQEIDNSSFELPSMDPTAAAFVPTVTLNQSLGLALVNEQQAHSATRAALRKETERSAQLEDQIKEHQQQISRLTATVNSLGAIIKHNLEKTNTENPQAGNDTGLTKVAEEAALQDFYRSNPRLAKGVDPVTRSGEPQHQEKHESSTSSVETAVALPAKPNKVDENQLFNFDLLTSPQDDTSPMSALKQTLRKQFCIAEDVRDGQPMLATPAKSRTSVNKLIDISPASEESAEKESEQRHTSNGSDCSASWTVDVIKTSDTGVTPKARLLTAETPVLELPTTFVNKYGRKPSTKEQAVLQDQPNGSNKKMALPKIDKLSISTETESQLSTSAPAQNHNDASLIQVSPNDNGSDSDQSDSAVAAFKSSHTCRAPDRVTIQLPGNFDGHPNWLLNKENPVFASEEEKWEAIGGSGIVWIRNSPFATHPVRYLPEDAVSDRNAYRTVMIDEIPIGTTMKDVLAQIRGGALESLQLLPPLGRVTSFMTARVVFLHETAADAMKERHQNTPFRINGALVRVWKPIDPTYPLSNEIDDAIWGEEEASRILLIGNTNDYLFGMLPEKLARLNLHRRVIDYSWTWDGYASIEFADVKGAFKFMQELKKDRNFYGADFRYDRDYTVSRYESAQKDQESAVPAVELPLSPAGDLATNFEQRRVSGTRSPSDTPAESPDLAEQFGYAPVSSSHAYSSLQRSLRPHVGMSLANGRLPQSMLQAYFKERYCRLVAQLPHFSVIRDLIDLLFSDMDWYLMCLDRCYFEDSLAHWVKVSTDVVRDQDLKPLSRELHYFPALLFQVLAVALQFLPLNTTVASSLRLHDTASLDKQSECYSKTGLEVMALLGRQQPTITSVEHDLLRLIWLKNCSRGAESWHFLNHGVRQAQLLGLHLEPEVKQESDESVESTLTRLWHAEHKRRIWARLFVLDGFMALTLGRPRLINKDDCSVAFPLDRDFPENPSRTVFLPPSKTQEPSRTTFMTYLCAISVKIHELFSARAGRRYINDYNKVKELQESIISIQQDLPRALQPEDPDTSWDARYPHFPKIRQQMISTANSFLMNLHRPYVDSHPASRHEAVESALKVLESQQAMFELMSEHQYKLYGYSFYTIDAGISLASLLIERPPETKVTFDRVQSALQKAILRLGALGTRVSIARTGEMILRQCLPKIQPAHTADSSVSETRGHVASDPVVASLQPRPSPSGVRPSGPLSSYRPVDEQFDFNDIHNFDLQSIPPPIDAAGFTNYFENANGPPWAAYNSNIWGNDDRNNTNPHASTGTGTSLAEYSTDPAATDLGVGGTELFSYGFDEYPCFFFNADLQDQATEPWP